MPLWLIILIAIIVLYYSLYFIPAGLWLTARFAGVNISIFKLIGLRIKKVPPVLIVKSLIAANEAGIVVTAAEMQKHYLEGGDINKTIVLMLEAKKEGRTLSYSEAAALGENNA
ncbi:hypothetical protein SDC9_43964 [bioreactor metagenome]|uniref:Uncharacterized protein n=1 Tax=bioreactor metagenome TaxID=1076179 RepID=A0A644W214_9ZZZZ